MSGKSTGAQPNRSTGDSKSRHEHHDGSSTRPYTEEQKAAVIRIRKCNHTDFYKILDLEEVRTTCTDGQIKKQYRRLSLLTHPDKNGYSGADDAFKMVSRAFQILSDADKRKRYDATGSDPDSRFGAASAGPSAGGHPFAGFGHARAGGGRGPMFEEEVSPEELFRQFFGGGMGGGLFGGPFGGGGLGGGGGPFVFNMGGGGPGIRVHQFGGGVPRRRPHNHADAQPTSPLQALQGLLPLLLLFILPVLSSLFSGGGSTPSGPQVRFDAPMSPQTQSHTSSRLGVQYFVNPADVVGYNEQKWKTLDRQAEQKKVAHVSAECEWEQAQRQRMYDQAQGFFFTDQQLLEKAKAYPMKQCELLRDFKRKW
ncbi:DUF1977-domain-containing protein [Polychaeton citri CBS 116435]|uniref:DUF1977-domain-containing protein n=1 Tax=Polychaeton citri CBS 116435 TaxID=1314669 RepID=A0A9P4Q2U1_9PEZI|nr:DUF1977-domain-containing protein [Polychaeton citri CBS 116435]